MAVFVAVSWNMGFIKGKEVEVILNAPLRDPIKYKIMGYEISLRRQEADMIEVISEEEARLHLNRRKLPRFHYRKYPRTRS